MRQKSQLRLAFDAMAAPYVDTPIDLVVGMESRGFIFGAALAYQLGAGFVPVRKPGKLPSLTRKVTYDLEYGSDTLEIHADAVTAGQRVLIVDDLLATGGTARATIDLVSALGAEVVGCAFLVELTFLKGRARLGDMTMREQPARALRNVTAHEQDAEAEDRAEAEREAPADRDRHDVRIGDDQRQAGAETDADPVAAVDA